MFKSSMGSPTPLKRTLSSLDVKNKSIMEDEFFVKCVASDIT